MKYKVKIKTPNKIFIVNNRQVRSPFECIVNEEKLNNIKGKIKFYGLLDRDYEISEISNKIEIAKEDDYSHISSKNIKIIETTTDKNGTEIEVKKIKNDDNIEKEREREVKKEILKREVKLIHDHKNVRKELEDKHKVIQKRKKENEFSKNREQNINEDNEKVINFSDTDVKIEELTEKSLSILEKFLENNI